MTCNFAMIAQRGLHFTSVRVLPLIGRRGVQRPRRGACWANQSDDEHPLQPPSPEPAETAGAPSKGPPAPADPAPPAERDGDDLQLPRAVVARLRETVFSLDTLFVRSVENYGASGCLFKGNVRGDPQVAYRKMAARLKATELGATYTLFLLEDQDESPVAVILPTESAQASASPAAEAALAALLGVITVATTLNTFDAQLFNAALLEVKFDPALLPAALPGALATLGMLGAHELGHWVAARRLNLKLAPPILIPAGLGLLGSFGGITRIRSLVPSRSALAEVAVAGPLAGAAVSFSVLLAGIALTKVGAGGVTLDSASFKESLLVGSLARAAFGPEVFTADALTCHPLLAAGWSGLIINAINALPAGELDGGRIFLALCGRRAASRMSALSFLLLGIGGFTNGLALFWLLLVLTLQRGPVAPCEEELSPLPAGGALRAACVAALVLPLLVLLPFPAFDLSPADGLAPF